MKKLCAHIFIEGVILLCFFSSFQANSQSKAEKKIDSLRLERTKTSDKVTKLHLLYRIGRIYQSVNIDSSKVIFEQVLQGANQLDNDTIKIKSLLSLAFTYSEKYKFKESEKQYGLAEKIINSKSTYSKYLDELYGNRGVLYYYMDSIKKAKKDYNEFLKIALKENNKSFISRGYNVLAVLAQREGNYEEALKLHLKSADLAEELKDSVGLARSLNNIGLVHADLDNIELSDEYYLKSLKIKEKKNDKIGVVGSYLNLGINSKNLGIEKKDTLKIKKAKEYYYKALNLSKEIGYNRGILNSYTNVALIENTLSNYKKGIELGEEALKFAIKNKSSGHEAHVRINLGDSYRYNKQLDKAEYHILEALRILKETKNNNPLVLKESYLILSLLYDEKRHFKKAYDYHVKYYKISDSIFSKDVKDKANELEIKYQTEKKEKELLQTKAEKATTELKLTNQKYLSYGLFGGLALLLLGGYSLIQRNKRKHQLAISQEKEAGLQAIIQAEENERTKIARELHDGVVQQIGSVILKSRNVLSKLNLLDKPESQELLKNLEDSNQDLRNISHQMMPRALNELGIIAALEDLLQNSLGQVNMKYSFEHFNIADRLPQKVEITIYRVCQELINNIIKHSKASEVSIQLFKTGNNLVFIVEDNGVGIATKKTKKGIGLLNISSRLDMVNGQVNFEPSPQSGTLVTIKIPV